ncbi:MAG: dUTPase [Candidatus Yanofskybacteria bacterium RIFCSPHIGHO2_02_FULL_41_29]|uniref:dUTP diphosphatase n=1 Tax=Candidatus Yanofskybacteria bacterium RIFCSPHIGHO2_01_FULL_41_53 TaxID=1802663 RepID=A0A1F8EKJ9_9BACT|nr:MAG: dUTPase [Candidatus Yanofskybacteria bacterium RIFCSPHIGHO2_01_FULL_41_53]OGN10878.1 MAG: dUTPase [Candidatus Yanofskybacteria bacterium RIFCSPHIGHO2_02_FULL_41_29]OGN16925.1 MAG: dUTPase [Candidatus Yanofskybacteria bacterium RIFCSPHIGHO2_12_FULL_41_9]OGN24459.1 MAG: dUTPase [Candidatus Yanofskybacteria bacterium RIFCSPLOWO2_01_FULL_41_67]OGN29547.1 MAG: dUTPase [Candidatus Yanofskybacteria bacterium RIFCSPLOWO2_02_FULL_41_13]OGN35707.1 MAG: dUTPase [Candidatus Yanofskybacteria bacter
MDKIKIKRFDKELPLPEYKTAGAAGFDLYAREKTTINPGAVGYVPLNVALETPRDHFLILAVRSSTHKLGLMPANGIGIGDSDFRGDEDEYKIVLLNFTKKSVTVERGSRIAQGLFVKITKAKWQEVDKMSSKTRGGFGSTGKK